MYMDLRSSRNTLSVGGEMLEGRSGVLGVLDVLRLEGQASKCFSLSGPSLSVWDKKSQSVCK